MTTPAAFPHPTFDALPQAAYVSITLRLADPCSDLLVRHVRLLRHCVALSQQRWRFSVQGAAVLPSELDLLCLFDEGSYGATRAANLIAATFARHVPDWENADWCDAPEVLEIATPVAPLRRAFIENSPVRAGLVDSAEDWPYSSAQRLVQATALGVAVA